MQSSCKQNSFMLTIPGLRRLAAASLLLASAAIARPPESSRNAPDFGLPDRSGTLQSLSAFRDRVVVLNFWATWCKPCRQEMPALNAIAREYATRGVTVLGVAMDERGWAAVSPFLSQFPVTYPILMGNPRVARDYGGLKTLPLTVFIDRGGRIVATHSEALTEAQLRKAVEAMLDQSR
jgi:cytochrome c biogenesis protein CcmG/thiol:disulfide interchange protein DsbE